jgi:hypothetical protein
MLAGFFFGIFPKMPSTKAAFRTFGLLTVQEPQRDFLLPWRHSACLVGAIAVSFGSKKCRPILSVTVQ